jgi:hypothetical protein
MKLSLVIHSSLLSVFLAFSLSCSSPKSDSAAGSAGASGSPAAAAGSAGSAGLPETAAQAGAGAGGGGATGFAGSGGSSGASAGGSGGSGGSGGTTAVGGGGAGGAGPCAYKLCEGFESGMVGDIPTGWTSLKGFGSTRGGVGLASDQAHSGSMALKSDSKSTGQDRVQLSLASLGATATKHWGRVFYKVQAPAPKPTGGVIHITFAALEGSTENRVVDTVEAASGMHQWLFNIPDDSCCTSSGYDWTFDAAWHCAEWNIDVAAESFHFYSDSKEVTQLAFTGKANAKMSSYKSLALGTIFYQTPPSSLVVWFDDLAIDDNQVGCQ